jgi:hypothetical protein
MAKKPMTTEEKTRRQKKTKSVRHLAENIRSLRNKVTRDLKSDDEKTRMTALAIALIDKTASRVGNSESAKNGHFGVTGWLNKHVSISGNTVTIKYVGKSGVDQENQVTDATIAKMLKKCKGECNGETPLLTTSDGISIKSAQVNRYLEDFGITAKDIRGYAANTLLVNMLKNSKKPSDEKERQKKFREVMKAVAEKVGHQQATLKQHYLLPGIEEAYVKHSRVKEVKSASVVLYLAANIGRSLIASRVARWAAESIKEFDGPVTKVEADTREVLKNWAEQKHYEGPSWDGIEKFHLHLAKVADELIIEIPVGSAWYPSTPNNKMEGKDWRYIITEPMGAAELSTVVNAHSMVHDDKWSLTTTIYSTDQLSFEDAPEPIGHYDPYVRSMLWSVRLAELLQDSGYDFGYAIDDMKMRMQMTQLGWKRIKEIKPYIEEVFEGMFGRPMEWPDYMMVVVADWDLPEGKIASYNYETGTMALSPKAFSMGILDIAVKHELCHTALGQSSSGHGEEFKQLAAYLGVPKEWQD